MVVLCTEIIGTLVVLSGTEGAKNESETLVQATLWQKCHEAVLSHQVARSDSLRWRGPAVERGLSESTSLLRNISFFPLIQ